MAKLTGFKTVDASRKEKADKSFSITNGSSPFKNGVEFTVKSHDYKNAEFDGKVAEDAKDLPGFVISLNGKEKFIFLKTVLDEDNTAYDEDGKMFSLSAEGEVNILARKIRDEKEGKSNGELLKAIVKELKNKPIVVTRVAYMGLSFKGNKQPKSLMELNFKERD